MDLFPNSRMLFYDTARTYIPCYICDDMVIYELLRTTFFRHRIIDSHTLFAIPIREKGPTILCEIIKKYDKDKL